MAPTRSAAKKTVAAPTKSAAKPATAKPSTGIRKAQAKATVSARRRSDSIPVIAAPELVLRFRNNVPMASCCIIDFITPGVDDWLAIDVADEGHQAFPEFVLG